MKKISLGGLLCIVCLLVLSNPLGAVKPDGTGTLAGKVWDSGSQAPIAGAIISARGTNDSGTATTDRSGTYSISLDAGEYTVTASAEGYTSETVSITVKQTAKTILSFSLSSTVITEGTLTGTITDTSGTPLVGALVSTGTGGYSGTTDGIGTYTINNIPVGNYTLSVVLDGYQTASQTVSVTSGGVTNTDFALEALPTITEGHVDRHSHWDRQFPLSWRSGVYRHRRL